MSKRFTDHWFSGAGMRTTIRFGWLLALAGCVSLESSQTSTVSSEHARPSDQQVDMAVNSEITPFSAADAPDAPPPPEVRKANQQIFDQAVAAMRAGRLREAEVLFLEITADQPELAGPWINLGQIYTRTEQVEAARQAFERAVSSNPWNCAAHNQLGVLSRQHGDFGAAEHHYLACLKRVPDFQDAYLNLGILYELYLGRLDDALNYYRYYQALLDEPDPRVQGWVLDLQRRLGV